MIRAFIRCNEGHYFNSECCPFDSWSSKESQQFAEIKMKITSEGTSLTFENFKEKGAGDSTISRIIIVEFGENNFVFDAISPDGYFIDGKYLSLPDLPRNFL